MSAERGQTANGPSLSGMWTHLVWLNTDRLLILILFLGLFMMAVRLPTDTDTWWHIRTGQYIVETHHIPLQDPFSHTVPGEPWHYNGWLSQLLLFIVYRWTGMPGLALGLAAVIVAAYWFVYQQCEANVYVRAFAVVLGALASALYWIARPQILTFLLASIFLYLLYLYKRRGRNYLYLLPLLFIVWVNVHAGFIIGFVLLGIYILGELANRLVGLGTAPVLSYRQIRLLLLTVVVSIPAVLVNPTTYRMLGYPFYTIGIKALQDYIQEWGSPNFHELPAQPFLWMFLILLAVIALSDFRIDFTDLFLIGVLGYMSFMAVRNVALFALAATPVLARHAESTLLQLLDAWRRRTPWGPWVDRLLAHRFSQTPLMLAVNWLLLGLVVLLALGVVIKPLLPINTAKELKARLPVDAVSFIEENELPRELFNSYNWGGYLIWRLYPEYRVFIDGRTDLYADTFIRRYLEVTLVRGDWKETLDRYHVNTILVEKESLLANFLLQSVGWSLVYQDELAVVFVRDGLLVPGSSK